MLGGVVGALAVFEWIRFEVAGFEFVSVADRSLRWRQTKILGKSSSQIYAANDSAVVMLDVKAAAARALRFHNSNGGHYTYHLCVHPTSC